MAEMSSFSEWIASVERGDCGFTYIRLYVNAPKSARNDAINHFGKGTVFLPPRQTRVPPADAAA